MWHHISNLLPEMMAQFDQEDVFPFLILDVSERGAKIRSVFEKESVSGVGVHVGFVSFGMGVTRSHGYLQARQSHFQREVWIQLVAHSHTVQTEAQIATEHGPGVCYDFKTRLSIGR